MSWENHINNISNVISGSIGILNKLKFIVPPSIKIMIYNAHLILGNNDVISACGFEYKKIFKLQWKVICVNALAKQNAHN